MKTTKKPWLSFASIVLVLFLALSTSVMVTEAQERTSDRVIRVSCPLQSGFFEVDKTGNYSGYTYEYLMKIAQRTGWRYEFDVYESTNEKLQAGMDAVKSGNADLMVSMVPSDELKKNYEFTSVPYGVSNFVLMADENNEAINERTYSNLPNLRVVLNPSAGMSNTLFDSYCKEKGIAYQPIYVPTAAEKEQMIKNGEADIFISKDVVRNDGFKTVAKFSSQPFYFASTKGNTQLTEELSRTIAEIDEADPYFEQKLHEKYFKYEADYQLSFTEDELDYMKTLTSIRVIIMKNRAPIEDYDPLTGEYFGIIVDIMKKMSAESGMRLEFLPVDNTAEARELLMQGQADVFAGFPYHYLTAEKYDVLLTSPVFTMPVVRVSNTNNQSKNEGLLVSSSIKLFEGEQNIRYVEDLNEIFDLINRGEYKEAYVNGYLAQHYLEQKSFPNTAVTQTPFSNYELCIGVNRNADLRLVSVLEQMISKIKASDVEDIVYQNTAISPSQSFFDMIRRNPTEFLVPLLVIFIAFSGLLLVLFFKTKRLNKLISEEKNRYQKISALDRLAQIYNNDTFKQMSKEYLSRTDVIPSGSFYVCDIDDFKSINDTYGHLMGDGVIRALGELLSTLFQEGDLVGRLGGDEFVVLMKGITDHDRIAKRCEEILTQCRTVSERCTITMSIGVAVFHESLSFNEIFKKADAALYMVKKKGKNGFKILSE